MSSTMWYIMQSIQSKYSLSERLIRTIAAIRSFPHDNVEDLIRKGADVNRMHGTLKPLHCACMVADADCVELLLEKGAEFMYLTHNSLYRVSCVTVLALLKSGPCFY
uniref:Ankyrin repeat and SOCS box containing 8 n=1 Tax=Gasterosteus aculeatus aculeatus TaxID=481459 RepID=A0AAQ4PAN4_GASAC